MFVYNIITTYNSRRPPKIVIILIIIIVIIILTTIVITITIIINTIKSIITQTTFHIIMFLWPIYDLHVWVCV